jgi:hypothetical protein
MSLNISGERQINSNPRECDVACLATQKKTFPLIFHLVNTQERGVKRLVMNEQILTQI